MKQFTVITQFRDKYTDEHYVPGVIFVSDQDERIADLHERGLIGREISQSSTLKDIEDEVAEESESSITGEQTENEEVDKSDLLESSEEVKPNAKSRKKVATDNA